MNQLFCKHAPDISKRHAKMYTMDWFNIPCGGVCSRERARWSGYQACPLYWLWLSAMCWPNKYNSTCPGPCGTGDSLVVCFSFYNGHSVDAARPALGVSDVVWLWRDLCLKYGAKKVKQKKWFQRLCQCDAGESPPTRLPYSWRHLLIASQVRHLQVWRPMSEICSDNFQNYW